MRALITLLQAWLLFIAYASATFPDSNQTAINEPANLTIAIPECHYRTIPSPSTPPLLLDYDCREAINLLDLAFPTSEAINFYRDFPIFVQEPNFKIPYGKKFRTCGVYITMVVGVDNVTVDPMLLLRMATRLRKHCVTNQEAIAEGGNLRSEPEAAYLIVYIKSQAVGAAIGDVVLDSLDGESTIEGGESENSYAGKVASSEDAPAIAK